MKTDKTARISQIDEMAKDAFAAKQTLEIKLEETRRRLSSVKDHLRRLKIERDKLVESTVIVQRHIHQLDIERDKLAESTTIVHDEPTAPVSPEPEPEPEPATKELVEA